MNRRRLASGNRDERGRASVELTLTLPVLLLFLGLILVGGRIWLARGQVVDAAQSLATAASRADSEAAGRAAANRALAMLREHGLSCVHPRLTLDLSGYRVPVGEPARVRATLTCSVPLADLAVPGVPGSTAVTASAESALDTHRRRG
ncbi:TadE/TadG family type IV pilus assembly protein [Granulicoccus phenolivorans]|uniref:TadE/TadG family type IV pilus assembly protein n=1 Tax=Granulicoccus phenolivorans TaxID=266854 RepID=UPI0003F55973|nr:TadE/TadG family type IV pilus assembly protein [Granulicoccus phenolivorans]